MNELIDRARHVIWTLEELGGGYRGVSHLDLLDALAACGFPIAEDRIGETTLDQEAVQRAYGLA